MRAKERTSIDKKIWWRVFTNEHIFVEVGDGIMTFAMMLDCCNKSVFDKITVQLTFIRTQSLYMNRDMNVEEKEFYKSEALYM